MIKSAPKDLTGILVALITPFTDDGKSIDATRLKEHIDRMITAGVHGLVPGGSTGEFTSLSLAERKQLTELVVKYAGGRVPVVAGVGALTSTEVLDLSVHASTTGADALMIVPPFYDSPSLAQLHELFDEVHAASGLPIMYYNIPSISGMKLSPRELADLAPHGVKYMKDTSGDAPALTDLLFTLSDEITAFNGWDTLTFYGLAAGARGSVWGATNVIPELSVALWNAVAVEHDLKKGRELWSRIFPICRFLESVQYSPAIKTGMELQGYKTGGVRKPFHLLRGREVEVYRGLLRDAGVDIVS